MSRSSFRPAPQYFAFSHDEVDGIVAEYELGAWHLLDQVRQGHRVIRSGDAQGVGRKVFIVSPAGRFVIKQLPWFLEDGAMIATRLGLQSALHGAGLPVPRLVPTRHGRLFASGSYCGREAFYVVQELVDGTAWAATTDEACGAATLITAWQGLPSPTAAAQLPHVDLFANLDGKFDLLEQAPAPPLLETFRQTAGRLRAAAVAAGYDARRQLSHGDLQPGNLLFANGHIAALLDFDTLCLDHPASDVACFLAHACRVHYWEIPPGVRFDMAVARAFLTEYVARTPLMAVLDTLAILPALGAAWALKVAMLSVLKGDRTLTAIHRHVDRVEAVEFGLGQACRDFQP